MKENDIDYELYGCEVDGRKALYCHFDNMNADFLRLLLPERGHWHYFIIGISA